MKAMKTLHFWKSLVCCTGLAMLTGCINLSPKQDPTRFYVLHVPAPEAAQVSNGPVTGVRSLQIEDYLNRPELMVRKGNAQIERLSLYRWAGSLSSHLQKEFQRWCERYQPERVFYFPPWDVRIQPERELRWEVRRLEGVQNVSGESYAVVELGWSWTVRGENPVTHRGEWQAPWDGQDASVLVDLLGQLLGQGFEQILKSGE